MAVAARCLVLCCFAGRDVLGLVGHVEYLVGNGGAAAHFCFAFFMTGDFLMAFLAFRRGILQRRRLG